MNVTDDPRKQSKLKTMQMDLRGFEVDDLGLVLRTESGRRFYYRLVYEVGGLESPVYEGGIKPNIEINMAYREGIRSVASWLKEEAQAHFPEQWRMLINERLSRAEQEARQRRDINKQKDGDHE